MARAPGRVGFTKQEMGDPAALVEARDAFLDRLTPDQLQRVNDAIARGLTPRQFADEIIPRVGR